MRLLPNQHVLGIALGERSMRLAEIAPSRAARGRWDVVRVEEFVFQAGVGSAADATTGAELAAFLRQHKFTASRAVVGVPARWLVARERQIPPSSPEQAVGILRLQAERSFSTELGDLVFDYAGRPDPASAQNLLLLAMPRRQLDRTLAVVEAAGLEAIAVTPTILALEPTSKEGDRPHDDSLVLSVTHDAVELSLRTGGSPRVLRHLSVRAADLVSHNGTRTAAVAALAAEIRRTISMTPGAAVPSESLQLWDGIGLEAAETDALSKHLGASVRLGASTGASALLNADNSPQTSVATTEQARLAPAVAVALAGVERRADQVDFLHPRLAAPRTRRVGRRQLWAAAVAGAILLALTTLWLDVRGREATLADLNSRLAAMAPDIEAAENTAHRVRTARGWFDRRTPVLECLRDITLAFPEAEPFYVTSFTLANDNKGTLIGRSPDRESVLDLVSRLDENENFSAVDVQYLRNATGASREVSFSVVFSYVPAP